MTKHNKQEYEEIEECVFVANAKIILPFIWGIFYVIDSIWKLALPNNTYSGVFPTLVLAFYFLSYDHRIDPQSRNYDIYYGALASLCITGDFIWVVNSLAHGWFSCLVIILMMYIVLDSVFLYNIWKIGKTRRPLIPVDEEGIFLVISRAELIFALYIPMLISNPDMNMVPINVIGYFIVFEFFGKHYEKISNRSARIQWLYWLFSIFALIAALFEWILIGLNGSADDDGGHVTHSEYEVISRVFDFAAAVCIYRFIFKLFVIDRETGERRIPDRTSATYKIQVKANYNQKLLYFHVSY